MKKGEEQREQKTSGKGRNGEKTEEVEEVKEVQELKDTAALEESEVQTKRRRLQNKRGGEKQLTKYDIEEVKKADEEAVNALHVVSTSKNG